MLTKPPPHPQIEVAGEVLTLLPQRAVYWARQRMLLVADAHFGKAARFRMHGVPIPRGTTDDNLDVLDTLLDNHAIDRIVFLGDLMHGRIARDAPTFERLGSWCAQRRGVALELIMGNHDRHAGALPSALSITVHSEPYRIGPFALCHHPATLDDAYVLAGHLHPVIRLYGRGLGRVQAPCFVFGPRAAVLPAFGAFTGGFRIARQPADRIWVVAGEQVLRLPG